MDKFSPPFVFIIIVINLMVTNIAELQAETSPVSLILCYLIERNTTGMIYDYNTAAPALDSALDYANTNILPPDLKLTSVYRDIGRKCEAKNHIISYAVDLRLSGINCNVFIGPGCGLAAEQLHDLAEFWNIPIIGCPSAGLGITSPASDYKLAARVSITYSTITDVLIRFFNDFNYTNLALFHDQDLNFFEQMGTLMQLTLRRRSSAFLYGTRYYPFSSSQFTEENKTELIQTQLSKASLYARMFILCADAAAVRSIMISASALGMTTGSFVFVAVELYPSEVWGVFNWRHNDKDDWTAREAYRPLLILSLKEMVDSTLLEFWRQMMKMSMERYNYQFSSFDQNNADPIVGHFYDAIILYSNIVTLLHKNGYDYTSGADFVSAVAGYSFDSPVTGTATFNSDSDRLLTYQFRALSERTGKHDPIFEYLGNSNSTVSLGTIEWFGTTNLPPNSPLCGYLGDNPVCIPQSTVSRGNLVAIICVFILPAFGGLLGYNTVKKVLNDQVDPFFWRIFDNELVVRGRNQVSASIIEHRSAITLSDDDIKNKPADPAIITDGVVALYGGTLVGLYPCDEPQRRIPPSLSKEAALMRKMLHPNIIKVIGISVSDENFCHYLVTEPCLKGSLHDLIDNQNPDLDWEFKNALIKDLTNGMHFLHASALASHGRLNDTTCQIDSRFNLKISHYGLESLRNLDELSAISSDQDRNFRVLLWQAPEFLRRMMPPKGTQKGDVYSYAILLQQIILRSDPFQTRQRQQGNKKSSSTLNPKDIVLEVKRGVVPVLRPPVPLSACSNALMELMENCWSEEPISRPSFAKIKQSVRIATGKSGDNIVDHLIRRLEKHSINLEHEVDAKTKQFMDERQRLADLLQVILPRTIAEAMVRGEPVLPETFESTTVYFGGVAGFKEALATVKRASEVIITLNDLYLTCDDVIAKFNVFKVEVVIDAYMVVSGLPVRNGSLHVEQISAMALMLRKEISVLAAKEHSSYQLQAGIHSGPCVAGVIGQKMPRYCLFGDTVNTASRMESHGEAGKIHCSQSSKSQLEQYNEFIVTERGHVDIKGKGAMITFWLIGRN